VLDWAGKVVAVAVVLTVIPWPLRIGTNATVVPAERRAVTAAADGTVQRVLVREGDRVAAGAVLAELSAGENRVRWERARSNAAQARAEMAQAESRRDLNAATQARLRMEMYNAEEALYREKVEKATLRASINGLVVTPKVEEKVGQFLQQGDLFCELVDTERMAAEMNVEETKAPLVEAGSKVALKLNAFPTQTFVGRVERVSAQTVAAEGEQFFVVRALFDNRDAQARTGMAGQGKISAAGGWPIRGWYPIGYVWFRGWVYWGWRKVWTYLP